MTLGPCGGATAQALSARTDTMPRAEIARVILQVPKGIQEEITHPQAYMDQAGSSSRDIV
jgi:hypothetical protein